MSSQAEDIASSEGGPKTDRSTATASKHSRSDKMEDDLITAKENKTHTSDANEVAGRKEKGTGTGLLEELVPGKK